MEDNKAMASTNLQQIIDAWEIFDGASTPRELRAAHEALVAPYPAEPDIESRAQGRREGVEIELERRNQSNRAA